MDNELQRFFGFSHPFGRIDDPADLFRPESRVGHLSGMVNDVLAGPVVTSVRGGRGIGKTSFAALLAAELRSRKLTVVPLGSTLQSPLKVQRQIGEALGIEAAATMKPDHLLHLLQAKEGMERIVLVFDDAQALPVTVFRYLQLLMGLFRFGPSQLSIILIGGFGQWANLESPDLEPIRSATTSFNMLFSLRDDEAAAYLEHKFDLAGRPLREIMSRSAASGLLAQACGNPAQIDGFTQQALQYAHDNQRRRVTASLLRRALPDDDLVAQPPRRQVGRTALAGLVVAALAVALFVWRDDIGDTLHGYAGGQAVASSTPAAPPPTTAVTAIDPLPAPLSEAPPAPGPADPSSSQALSLPEPPPIVPTELAEHETASPAALPSAAPSQPAMGLPASAATDTVPPPDVPPVPPAPPDKTEVATSQPAPSEPAPSEPAPSGPSAPMASPDPVAPVTSPPLPSPPLPPQEAAATVQTAPERPHNQQPAAPLPPPSEPLLADPSAPPSSRHGGPGLVLVAQGRDDLRTLYARVYRGMTPPPLSTVLAANPAPVRPGTLLIFPEPPDGWTSTRGRSP